MTYLDYFPVDQNRAGQLQAPAGGIYSQWATRKDFHDFWGMPGPAWADATPEVFGLEVIDGDGWLTLRGFVPKTGPMHQLKTLKAIVTRDGKAKEIACRDGHPYALLTVQQHEIEVWGTIVGPTTLQFWWRATYALVNELNPIMNETRACVEQRECWWDSGGGWVRGGPDQRDALPFVGGKLVQIKTTLAGYQCVGKDYGPAWTLGTVNDGKKILSAAANSHGWNW